MFSINDIFFQVSKVACDDRFATCFVFMKFDGGIEIVMGFEVRMCSIKECKSNGCCVDILGHMSVGNAPGEDNIAAEATGCNHVLKRRILVSIADKEEFYFFIFFGNKLRCCNDRMKRVPGCKAAAVQDDFPWGEVVA
mgnify:CR=1 FL=1